MMLPTGQEWREAVDIVRPIGYVGGEITPESEVTLGQIERIPLPRAGRRRQSP